MVSSTSGMPTQRTTSDTENGTATTSTTNQPTPKAKLTSM